MAQKVTVQLVDDLDGTTSEDISTVLFGLDGVSYEIDMSDANAKRLRDGLAEYVDSARRIGGRVKRGTKSGSQNGTGTSEAGQIREWAPENGFELSARGRIPSHVVEAYKQAQATPEPAKKLAKSRAHSKKQ
jgi:hypothetical protein